MFYAATVCLLIGALTLAWFYSKRKHRYWSDRDVAGPKPTIFFGNILQEISFKKRMWLTIDKVYNDFPEEKLYGTYNFHSPSIMLKDLDIIKHVLVKDFDHFVNRRDFPAASDREKKMGEMLTAVKGESWKNLRAIMSPTFSSGKMKVMFPMLVNIANKLRKNAEKRTESSKEINVKNLFGNYAIEVISSCVFGIDCNALEEENGIFVKNAADLTAFSFIKFMKTIVIMTLPKIGKIFKFSMLGKQLDFFSDVVNQALDDREKNKNYRGDFVDLMYDAKKEQEQNNAEKYPVTRATIVSQSVLFFFAGYETITNALCFATYELAKNPEIQETLHEELHRLQENHGEFTYQDIMESKYMDAFISESMRFHPPAIIIERTCNKDYTFPGTNVTIMDDQMVKIPVWSLHFDSKYWDEPTKFSPDRFLPENKSSVHPYAYLPFGLGPRNCIGMRFALMEVKTAIAFLVMDFKLKLAPGHEEIQMDTGPGQHRPGNNGLNIIFEGRS